MSKYLYRGSRSAAKSSGASEGTLVTTPVPVIRTGNGHGRFDERSGIVPSKTDWGLWWQTVDEIHIEVNVPPGSSSKDISCQIKSNYLKVTVKGNQIIEGKLPGVIHPDDSVWTLEDKKLLRICLPKSNPSAANCWKSLLVGQYNVDPYTFDQMEKKLTLQRFQLENPGFDFSGASVSGNYHGGGPDLPS
ncbi:hypothetical protein KUTeg_024061 [Tegillarca granosa]|uniref:CS domain-containing protein n=1 Tax=Tegillarca granosa TaxID=220873 RepID=A0ABQ9DXB8_TEGGR|nr:hypothetical protein KUTeg_024061 [Tegillarca granosa]